MKRILAADIGGTSSRFAAFTAGGDGVLRLDGTRWLKTKDASSFAGLLGDLRETELPFGPGGADMAVFAVPGPVRGGRFCSPPNIDWDIDLDAGGIGLDPAKAVLVNDFSAQAFATRSPVVSSAEEVLPGKADGEAAVAVIGAGTGLGHAALVGDGRGGYIAVPAEKGHAAFPMGGGREKDYQAFLCSELGEAYPRGDSVVSGGGMALLHRFLTGEALTPEELTPRLVPGSETLAWFARFYGRACRDYALTVLAKGGVYIAGGLAARTPALVKHEAFALEFRLSPTMGDILSEIPVFLLSDQESGLWGAARYGLQMLSGS